MCGSASGVRAAIETCGWTRYRIAHETWISEAALCGFMAGDCGLRLDALDAAMYERFTDRARKVVQLACQEAQRLQHYYVNTEAILLGAEGATHILSCAVSRSLLYFGHLAQNHSGEPVMSRLPRRDLIEEPEVGIYHCVRRAVRRAFLCGQDAVTGQNFNHRKV